MSMYEVVAAKPLPGFNPSKTVRHVLFTPPQAKRVHRLMRQSMPSAALLYFVGCGLFAALVLAPTRAGRYLAVIETIVEIPVCTILFLSLRVDMVKLVQRSYDYWFFSMTTVLFAATFSRVVGDIHGIVTVARVIGFQVPILIDANMNQAGLLLVAMAVNILLIVYAMFVITMEAMPDLMDSKQSNQQTLSPRDMPMNSFVTMLVLLLRIMIRKRELSRQSIAQAAKRQGTVRVPTNKIVQCVTLRCTLRLHEVTSDLQRVTPSTARRTAITDGPDLRHASDLLPPSPDCVRLRRVPTTMRYNSDDTVLPTLASMALSWYHKTSLAATGAAGVVLSTLCCLLIDSTVAGPTVTLIVCIAAAACTVVFFTCISAFFNRRLLSLVCTSFDFVFLSVQITIAHLCACDMMQWRLASATGILCTWLWIHLLLTLDALTPAVRLKLAFRSHWYAVPVLVLYVTGQALMCFGGVFMGKWQVKNGVILRGTMWGHEVEFRVVPMFVSRLVMVSVWTLRLLWRFYCDVRAERLIMIRGLVEFEYDPRTRSSQPTRIKSIVPAPPPIIEKPG